MTVNQMYLIVKLDDFQNLFFAMSVLLVMSVFVGNMISYGARGGWFKEGWFLIPITIIFAIAGSVIPSTKQMAAILLVPKIVNNANAIEMPKKLLGLANEWIEELRPKKD